MPNYGQRDYLAAIDFALNYPDDFLLIEYDIEKDIYITQYLENGWYIIALQGKFVRNCLKWKGIKKWKQDFQKHLCI